MCPFFGASLRHLSDKSAQARSVSEANRRCGIGELKKALGSPSCTSHETPSRWVTTSLSSHVLSHASCFPSSRRSLRASRTLWMRYRRAVGRWLLRSSLCRARSLCRQSGPRTDRCYAAPPGSWQSGALCVPVLRLVLHNATNSREGHDPEVVPLATRFTTSPQLADRCGYPRLGKAPGSMHSGAFAASCCARFAILDNSRPAACTGIPEDGKMLMPDIRIYPHRSSATVTNSERKWAFRNSPCIRRWVANCDKMVKSAN